MTGEEFIQKVREMKEITEISYDVKGDFLNPDEVKLKVVADNSEYILSLGSPAVNMNVNTLLENTWHDRVSVCLVVNRLMEIQGRTERFDVNCGIDIQKVISFAMKCLNNTKNDSAGCM